VLLVESAGGQHYVVRLYTTAAPAEVQYELAAVALLASRGFPTPAPEPAGDGSLAGKAAGRPAAVFRFAAGRHPAGLGTRYRQDLELGLQAAGLAGRLHQLSRGVSLPGARTDRLDPLRRIGAFLDSAAASEPALADAVGALSGLRGRLTELYRADGLPRGLVHNDISAHNLLLDPAGSVAALIDFDDCVTSFLLYDLGRIVEVWGCGPDGRVDPARVDRLIGAYSAQRPLTGEEEIHARWLIAAYAGATGAGYLTGMIRAGAPVSGPHDSTAMSVALQLLRLDAAG
jgi:Ser/Thr protein kinase RdoA (MazF antagonist)